MRAREGTGETLEHWNQGIDKPSWFHQHLGREAPDWLTTIDTPTRVASRKTVSHLVVDGPESLRWLAQMSVLTIHMWASRGENLNEADWMVFDLDPAKGKGIERRSKRPASFAAARNSICQRAKTSGKRGSTSRSAQRDNADELAEFAFNIARRSRANYLMTVDRANAQARPSLSDSCRTVRETMVALFAARDRRRAGVCAAEVGRVNNKLDQLKLIFGDARSLAKSAICSRGFQETGAAPV